MSIKKHSDNFMNLLEKVKIPIYVVSIATMYMMYFVVFFGIFEIDDNYIRIMQVAIQTIICLFLLIRFNPFMKPELKPYDSNIIFTSAVLLLSNVIIVEIGLRHRITNVISKGAEGVGLLGSGVSSGILAAILI